MATADVRGARRTGTGPGGSTQAQFDANENNEQLVAMGNPPYTEMTRKGQGWSIRTTTLFTTVAAYPTTTAALEIFNNTSGAASQNLVVADLFAAQILATAAVQTYAIYAMVTTSKAAPSFTALTMFSLSGKAPVTTVTGGQIVTGVGTTVVDNGWAPWGSVQAWGTNAATPGNAWSAEVNGKLIVPPGAALCVTVAGSIATASSFQCGARFYIAPLTMVP